MCRVCNSTGQDCRIAEGSVPGEGIEDVDFVFYVSAMQTDRCNKSLTVAYAAHCQQESVLDRYLRMMSFYVSILKESPKASIN